MKRILIAVAALVLAAAAFSAWGAAAPAGKPSSTAAAEAKLKKPVKPKLPTLPSQVKNRKRWEIRVKCDFPPFGFIDVRGNNDGYDVRIARRFAELAFGSKKKVNLTCRSEEHTSEL